MQQYFIHDGHKQLGPFSTTELINKGISASTPVYTPLLKCYMPAAEIPELDIIFKSGVIAIESKKTDRTFTKWSIAGAALILIIVSIVIFKLREEIQDSGSVSSPADAAQQQAAAMKSESIDPSKYLHVRGKMHNNLLGKKIIKGKINNLASFEGFKELHMAVTFLSGKQKELGTQHFVINDVVAPNNEISFRDVFTAPEETAGFTIKIVSAVPAY